jgi:hypothetical protein
MAKYFRVSGNLLLAFTSTVILGSGTARKITTFFSVMTLAGEIVAGIVSTVILGS